MEDYKKVTHHIKSQNQHDKNDGEYRAHTQVPNKLILDKTDGLSPPPLF